MSNTFDDDEDDFLYGSASAGPAATSGTSAGGTSATGATTNPPISLTENGTASAVKAEAPADEGDGEEAMEEGTTSDEESEDDIEIVMDINPSNPPPAHQDLQVRPWLSKENLLRLVCYSARRQGAIPFKQPPSSALDAQPRAGSTPVPTLPASQSRDAPVNPFLTLQPPAPAASSGASIPPARAIATGLAVPAPPLSPPPNINDASAVYSHRAGSAEPEGEDSKPAAQPIIDVDLDNIEEKRWRKPGAYLADYFNYGFDEATWLAWCSKQKRSREERDRERDNPFHVFASRPMPEAWASLPMELKGMMMQTIMTSFSNQAPGGGMMGMPGGMSGMGMPMGMGMGMPGMGNPMMGGMGNQGNMGNFNPGMGFQGGNAMGMGGMNAMMNQARGPSGSPYMQQREGSAAGGHQGSPGNGDDDDNGESESQRQSQFDEDEADSNDNNSSHNPLKRPPSSDFVQQQPRMAPNQMGGMPYNNRGRGAMMRGRGGFNQHPNAFGRGRGRGNMPPPQNQRNVSPLPENLPKGPRSMVGGR